jgi:signal transduction histidine kinase/ligand-binding sensor domain-containing protein/DNA-binding response OmpR family regulator
VNNLTQLVQDDDGKVWIGTTAGIDVYDPQTGTFSNTPAGVNGLSSNNIISLYKGLNGVIWVGTLNGGLYKWQKEENRFKAYRSGGEHTIRDNIVRAIYQKSADTLYVGTEKGLNVLDLTTDKFTAYTNKVNDPFGISDNAVYAIYLDKAGTMWLGTWFGGVSYFHEGGSAFELYYPSNEKNSLQGRAVSCFLEDEPGKFWIGTEDGGLHYFNSEKKRFSQYPFLPNQEKLSYHNVHCLFKDKDGNIWIGLFAGGLNILNPATGKITRYSSLPGNKNTLNSNLVFCIYQDRDNVIWVGTSGGLSRYNEVTKSFNRVEAQGVSNTLIYDIYQDDFGNLWFATYYNNDNGLIVYNKKSGQWNKANGGKSNNSLSSTKLTCLHDDHAGNLWVGTDGGGLNRFNIKTREVQVYDEKDGIDANVIYGIQEDDNGVLWITSNNGIYSFNTHSNQVRHFTRQDNLQSQQFNYKAFYKASDGKLFAGGTKGFNAFYPAKVSESSSGARISFTNFQLFNRNVLLSDEQTPLTKQINYTKTILLSHNQSVFSLEFAALNATTPEKIRYAYKMEGFDAEWNYVESQRKATYTNLSHGKYLFKVKATTGENGWDVPETTMTVVIKPPFYKTTVSYIIYLLLVVAAIFVFFKYTGHYIRRQNEIKLERLKNKEEQEFYARKIEFFTVMAHEIRTPLSLIIAPLEKLLMLNKSDKEEKEQLQIMEENADRLLNLVNQLLDFRRIESDAYKIKKEKMEVVSLVQALYSRFSSFSYQKGIEFSLSTNIDSLVISADPEVLNKILSNLLINAFRFAREVVKIAIHDLPGTNGRQNSICISVYDDGIGIPETDIKNIFKKFFTTTSGNHEYHNLGGTGIGLALASSLAEKHGAKLLVESRVGVNTVFTLELGYTSEKEIGIPEVSNEKKTDTCPIENQRHILVVEDDKELQLFIGKSLKAEGYDVLKAPNGKEAMKLLESTTVDLIISDVMMPEMDGFDFCHAVKTNIIYSHIPFILLTAKGNSDAEIRGIEIGADAYLLKPFKWKHVTAVVKNLLNSRELLKLKFSQQPTSEISVLTTNTRDREFMERIVHVIRSRIIDPQLSVEELSKEMAMSRSSLHKKLKSLSGYVPNELIKLIRLKQGAKLLQSDEHTVADIAYLTGFSSSSYFSKCFQQQFKLTPKEFAADFAKKNKLNRNELIDEDDSHV